ncbi:hypothetical protein CW708_01325 [Candidatus Bathyarchaeota archaeon]|nr:MAG: hypothetical protein CW708_01325 [Candidatus Bathyarchaeota archaeon]
MIINKIVAMAAIKKITSRGLNSFSSNVDFNFPSTFLFRNNDVVVTANSVKGMAMSKFIDADK